MALGCGVRYLSLITVLFLATSLSSCGTVGNELISTIPDTDQLPPQNLASGKCGLFIWTLSEPQKFIGFETDGRVKLLLNDTVLSGMRESETTLGAPERVYQLQGSQIINLTLEESKSLEDGLRYVGRMQSKTSEGWDKIMPVVAISSCVP